jgi:hypothetical protein
MALSLIHTLCISLQQALSLLSLLCLHQSCLVTASNGGRSPYSRFPNCPRPQLQASDSNSSQLPTYSSPLTHCSPTNSVHCTQLHCTHSLNRTQSVESYSLGADLQRTQLATSLILLRDVIAYLTCSFVACIRAIT